MALVVSSIPVLDDQDAIEVGSRLHPGWKIELTESGSLVASPTFSDGGARNAEAVGQLRGFAKIAGGKAFGSSTGFRIPGCGLRSPGASWISADHLARLAPDDKQKFWKTYPDVVVELLSDTDSWTEIASGNHALFRVWSAICRRNRSYRRDVFVLGTAPSELTLDFDAITTLNQL